MTREEAIRLIGWLKCTTNREDDLEAIDMAIEALSADAIVGKIQIDDMDKAKTSSQLLDDLAVDMVKAMGKRIVEVVRCKDCIHYEKHETWSACTYWSGDPYEQASVIDEDFCSYGERRET